VILDHLARLERAALELGKLVQKEHAAVGERDFTGLRRSAAADQARRSRGVMRRAERTLRCERGVERRDRAVDPRHLDRLVPRERRQEPGQPPREHRLAGSGRADEQRAMSARGGDLEPALGELLAAHLREVGQRGLERLGLARECDRQRVTAA
jgi:hypothetical protein